MAIRHGKAGQRLKDQATRRYRLYLLSGFFMIAALMWITGFLMGRYSFAIGSALLIVPAALLWGLMRLLEKQGYKWAKERIRLLRAGQTEALVAWMLDDLPDSYHVYNNVNFPGGDLDHIVVGPAGLFVISTKNYRGAFTRNANGVIYHNGAPTDDPRQALKQAMWLKEELAKTLGGETPWIQPILCIPLAHINFDGRSNSVWLLNDHTLIESIDPVPTKRKLSALRVGRIVRLIDTLHT